ncbi:hypothetical protein [Methanococcoides alaskense]|uniref:Nicotinate-nucleotide pyrophosphorylase n=1 Tax=Methanococcoides alaskense TaxID=325778 RepID=A0AA90U1S1_9EURY|nr:hypothetical protein [Methanococcoides alaskense]MDA0524141.1 hypothetical protein [Methanococcoides alaskense]MDR6223870.1 nicotinate-nucleotide pyrophosphorylase [Methanococcoides alaskense]
MDSIKVVAITHLLRFAAIWDELGGIEFNDIPKYAEVVDIVVTTAPYYAKPFDLTTKINRL